jgi:hypothetical protein
MTGDPLGSAGRCARRTAPGGGTNSRRIALASAAARCCGVPEGWPLTASVPADSAGCDVAVAVPQPTARTAHGRRSKGPVFRSITPLRRLPSRPRFHRLIRPPSTFLVTAGGGLYWLIPAAVFSLVGGVINAWLFLVGA